MNRNTLRLWLEYVNLLWWENYGDTNMAGKYCEKYKCFVDYNFEECNWCSGCIMGGK